MSISYEKYHGTSNDFVIVDADEYVPDRGAFARAVCDRRDGVGADGVLFLALEPRFSPPRVVMTLVQPDGSTAAMCGNGARCAAKWAAERTGADTVMLDTQAGTRRADIDGERVTIEMGRASFEPKRVPLAPGRDDPLVAETVEGLEVTAVNTGVPHAVAFVDDVAAVDLEAVAPAVRHADAFPEGANVTVASRREDGSPASAIEGDVDGRAASVCSFDQRTFERGVEGETQSCGTGAVAVVAAARRLGRIERPTAAVYPPGGRLDVTVTDDGEAILAGPAEREFEGEVGSTPKPRQITRA